MKNRRALILAAIITGLFSLIAAIITCSTGNEESSNIVDNENSKNITVDIEESENKTEFNTSNSDNSVINNIKGDLNNYINDKDDDVKSYKIEGSNLLLKRIKESQIMKINQNSDLIIKLSYSGSLNIISTVDKTYNYSGGIVIILLNDEKCYELNDLSLTSLKPNTKSKIEKSLARQIESHVNKNLALFEMAILHCL